MGLHTEGSNVCYVTPTCNVYKMLWWELPNVLSYTSFDAKHDKYWLKLRRENSYEIRYKFLHNSLD